jgi:ketosteroid isomerase-like protein
MGAEIPTVLTALQSAMNAHDLDALVACFAPDYRNETPVHPGRNFIGRDQVHRNWTTILAATPDLCAELVRWTDAGALEPGTLWAEWSWTGTRPHGVPVHLAGVTVLGTGSAPGGSGRDAVLWARFYMEPVEGDTGNADGIRRAVGTEPAGQPAGAR